VVKLILRRILASIPVLILVSFGVTALILLIPGGAAVFLAGGENATPQKIAQIREQLHLNEPIWLQYWHWLTGVLHGNLGQSLVSGQPISQELPARLGVTAQLMILALVLALVLMSIAALAGGLWPGSVVDRAIMALSNIAVAVPAFLFGIVFIVIFSVRLRWLPPLGYVPFSASPQSWFEHMILPAASLALLTGAALGRQLRAGIGDTTGAPFVRTAWAKGGRPHTVLFSHMLRNAAVPTVTVFGLQVGLMLGGTVIIENMFSLPGLGSYLVSAIGLGDLPVVQAVIVVFVLARLIVNLLVDIVCGLLDPRVRA
jgi:peptide/nickel transport system permease protein